MTRRPIYLLSQAISPFGPVLALSVEDTAAKVACMSVVAQPHAGRVAVSVCLAQNASRAPNNEELQPAMILLDLSGVPVCRPFEVANM